MYKIKDIHYKNCDYFDKELCGNNYNIYDDPLLCNIYDNKLITDVLDSFINNNYDFINENNKDNVKDIFNHLGCNEGSILNIIYSNKFNNIDFKFFNLKIQTTINNYNLHDNYYYNCDDYEIYSHEYNNVNYDIKNEQLQYIKNINKVLFTNIALTKKYISKEKYEKLSNQLFFEEYFYNNIDDIHNIDNTCYYLNINKIENIEKVLSNMKNLLYINYNINFPIENILEYIPNIKGIVIKNNKILNGDIFSKLYNLSYLKICDCYKHDLNKIIFPDTLKHLDIHSKNYDKLRENILPPNLEYLYVDMRYSYFKIENFSIPNSLKFLMKNYEFVTKINEFSKNDIIRINNNNHPIKNSIKQTITINNNTLIKDLLLPNSEIIDFNFDQISENNKINKLSIPNVKILRLQGKYDYDIDTDTLPDNLRHLYISYGYKKKILEGTFKKLKNLKYLIFDHESSMNLSRCNDIPKTLKYFYSYSACDKNNLDLLLKESQGLEYMDIEYTKNIDKNTFYNAKSLKYLTIRDFKHKININSLPENLEYLYLSLNYSNNKIFNKKVFKHLKNLKYIFFNYKQKFDDDIFKYNTKLHTIEFGREYNLPLNSKLFIHNYNLKKIIFGYMYNQKIKKNILPSTLEYISFNSYYNQKFEINVLPKSLITLKLDYCYNRKIKKEVIEQLTSLKYIYLCHSKQRKLFEYIPNNVIIKYNIDDD